MKTASTRGISRKLTLPPVPIRPMQLTSIVYLCATAWGLRFASSLAPVLRPSPQHHAQSSTALALDGKGMAGGTQHIVGDVIRALKPSYLSRVADAVRGQARGPLTLNSESLIDGAPSWEDLAGTLRSQQTSGERRFRDDLAKGAGGEPSALAERRLFGTDEARVVFYRDSAAWCPYCQKVWIALEERRVPYEIRKIDMRCYGAGKPDAFLRLQPNGNLPCAVIDGTVYGESDEIVDVIDKLASSATPSLRPPPGSAAAERLAELCDDGRNSLERRLYSRWMWWLTGVRRPKEYRELFEAHLDEVEEALAAAPNGGPFFLGKELSLADVRFVPFVERQVASLAYFKGYDGRDGRRPRLEAWIKAMEKRPSYRATKSEYYTTAKALPPQLSAGCAPEPGCENLRDAIDFLPASDALQDIGDGIAATWIEPGWEWCNEAFARREAAERVLHNREAIVRFACRAAGTPGFPASSAPLADPRSTPSDEAAPAVDVFLRHAVASLLSRGGIGRSFLPKAVEATIASLASCGGSGTARAVASCLDYLRARIGVPRDMSHPAAQELRRELRLLSAALSKAAAAAEAATGGSTVTA